MKNSKIVSGAYVTLTDPNRPDATRSGTLVDGYATLNTYGVHTIRLDSGELFRNEGRLSLPGQEG